MENTVCNNCGSINPATNKYCIRCGHELPRPVVATPVETVQPLPTKNNRIKTMIGLVVGFAAMYAVQYFFFKAPSYDKVMMQMASELNKTCPLMVDKETRLDNAVALPGNIFQYNYTLVNADKGSIDTLALKTTLEPNIVNFIKTNPEMKIQRDNKTTMVYYYTDKNRQYLFSVAVSPEKYE